MWFVEEVIFCFLLKCCILVTVQVKLVSSISNCSSTLDEREEQDPIREVSVVSEKTEDRSI